MPYIKSGLLKGFYRPDYRDGCIVNLLASIIRSRGGRSPHADLSGLPARVLRPYRKIVSLVIDGLGEEQLGAHLNKGLGRRFFAAQAHRVISTVFPATTAAAVTTFSTGASPAEHGVLGWFINLHDLGVVGNVLLEKTMFGTGLNKGSFLSDYLKLPSHLNTISGTRALLSDSRILRSQHSQSGTKWTRRLAFATLGGMGRAITAFARSRGRGFAYAYWPEYDHLCHGHGCLHKKTAAHFEDIDRTLAQWIGKLAGTGTALIVTADHGLVDVAPDCRVNLTLVEGLLSCLATLPSGDARAMSCFVRPRMTKVFETIVRGKLSASCVCVRGEDLMAQGFYGEGRPYPSLGGRVGDYVLIARDGYAFSVAVPGGKNSRKIGEHGGLSAREVRVPLYIMNR